MLYRQLGSTDLQVSVLGYGCWATGNDWTDSNDNDSIAVIKEAIDGGVNLFDVAPVYGFGHAEEVLGKALQGRRSEVFVATKCGLKWDSRKHVTRDLSPTSIFKEIEASLRRLQTDYVDVYQMHWPDPNVPIEDTMEALVKLKEAGKIRHISASNFSVPLMEQARQIAEIASNQVLYNMIERNPLSYHGLPLEYRTELEILPYCRQNKIGVIPYSPLFQGLLTGKFNIDSLAEGDVRLANPEFHGARLTQNLDCVQRLGAVAERLGKPLVQLAINWLAADESISTIIAGATNTRHLHENIAALTWTLTDEDRKSIQSIVSHSC